MIAKGSKFCENCREAVMANFRICPKCGSRKFSADPPKPADVSLQSKGPAKAKPGGWNDHASNTTELKKKPGLRKVLVRLLSITAIFAIAGGIGFGYYVFRFHQYRMEVEAGEVDWRAENYVGAIDHFTKAIAIEPGYTDPYFWRARAYDGAGQPDKAIADYTLAINAPGFEPDESSDPHHRAYANRGLAYYGMGLYAEALDDFTKAIETNSDPDNWEFDHRAQASFKLGLYDSVIADTTTAISKDRFDREAFGLRAEAYYQKGDTVDGAADADRAVALKGQTGSQNTVRAVAASANSTSSDRINVLNYLKIDPETGHVTFYGSYDPAGPQSAIPYGQFLAAALRLPDESGTAGQTGSVPGFSLEPIQDINAVYAQIKEKTMDAGALNTMFKNAMQTADHDTQVYMINSIIDDMRKWLRDYLAGKTSSRDWVPAVNDITNVDQLLAVIQQQVDQHVVDRDEIAQAFDQAAATIEQQRLQQQGGMIFLPHGLLENIFNLNVYSRPTYYGIEPNTQLARTIFESDVALKRLAGPRGHELAQRLKYHQTLFQWIVNHSPDAWQNIDSSVIGSVQVSPGTIAMAVSADKSIMAFDNAEMRILVAARDPRQQLPQSDISYANFLTGHYDDYAREVGPLWEIREAMKVVAAARQLRSEGVTVHPDTLDTSWVAPDSVKAEWDFADVGGGPSENPTTSTLPIGGVDLQIEKHTQVTTLPEDEVQKLEGGRGSAIFGTTNSTPTLESQSTNSVSINSTADAASSIANSGAEANRAGVSDETAKALAAKGFDTLPSAQYTPIIIKQYAQAAAIQASAFPGLPQQSWAKLQKSRAGNELIHQAATLLTQKVALQQTVDAIRNGPNAAQHQAELIEKIKQSDAVTNQISGLQAQAQKIIVQGSAEYVSDPTPGKKSSTP